MASRRLSAFSVYSMNTPKPSSDESPASGSLSSKKKRGLKSASMVVDSPVSTKRPREFDESIENTSMNGKKSIRAKKTKRANKSAMEEHDDHDPEETSEIETSEKIIPCGNEASEELFQWIISPIKPSVFIKEKLDNKPFFVKRDNPSYYTGVFSTQDFDTIMRENSLEYEKEIDVVAYVNNKRDTLTDEMKVHPSFVWKAFKEGYSIRMRNPQAYSKKLWNICSLLQEYFSSFVGINMYLTPAGSQGFPPHYDDIDAFILQIEGKKLWKLYHPRSPSEMLSRYSSGDMTEDQIGKPLMEIELKAGDLLYFPRGVIHQAMTSSEHSLHLTVSCNQLNTWGDLLQIGFTNAVEKALKQDVEFRKSLPKDFLEYAGAIYSDCESEGKSQFIRKFEHLAQKTLKYLSVDHAVDVHATDFIHGSMPPILSKVEESCSMHGNGSRLEIHPKTGKQTVFVPAKLTAQTKIRWIRKRAFRLIMDEEGVKLFYSLGNSKNHKEEEAAFMEMDEDVVPAINLLFKTHPDFVRVEDFPLDSMDTKLEVAQQLYDNGFLMTEESLPYVV